VIGVGLVVGYGQVGFRLAPKAVSPDASKLDPIKGFQRLFSLRSWVRTGLSALKIVAIASSMVAVAVLQLPAVIRMGATDLGPLLAGMGHVLLRATLAGLAAMVLISVIDVVYQRLQHAKDLRMTKEEVKQEHKTTEGDPHVKARVRSLQREASRRRMMAEVPNATVVVTNPDHYAVALSYQRDERGEPRHDAPRVVAKGADLLAQRIKQVARDAGVPCYEDVPLARALFAKVEIGDEIPEDMYAAVAAVLNYVYRIQGSLVGA
jgi:flagellar biosynthetic protein FlhB